MEEEILGSIYYKASEAFQRGISPLARGIKAENHDLAVVTVEGTPKVKQLGNILPTSTRDNSNQGRVYDTSGLSPSITDVSKGGGGEPMIVAMRGRNPDNPSDRTAGSPTEQRLEPNSQGICNTLTSVQKDNMVLESAVLTPKRTEYGKAIRKAYENGEIKESRHNMTELEPRKDGVSNTLTTVQKDNMLLEQSILQTPRGYNSGGCHKICPPITSCSFHENNFLSAQYRIRKLTPLECWRLMGFSDEDFLSAKLGSRQAAKETLAKYPHLGRRAFTEVQRIEKMSNSQLYKQAGNSIVKNVLTAIFAQIFSGSRGI